MKEYKLCSASFFPCWQNCSSCLTSRRTDPWRWTGLLIAWLLIMQHCSFHTQSLANSECSLHTESITCALQVSFKQGPMPGAGGGGGRITSGSKARITYWINNLHHLYKRRERERKWFLHHNYCSKQFWERNGLSLGLTKLWQLLYFMQNVHT